LYVSGQEGVEERLLVDKAKTEARLEPKVGPTLYGAQTRRVA